tara:strand:- start:1 stop:192 length:192 start_codon:yes stop_codon:yes gene_type:complete
LIIDMKSSEILYQLQDLREIWRKQSFTFTIEQQRRYDELVTMRRARVAEMYENDLVYKPGSSK